MSVSVAEILKNRCQTWQRSRWRQTLAELPFTGDHVVCLSRDQAARSAPVAIAWAKRTCSNRMGNPKSAETSSTTPAMQSDRKPQLCWERPPFRMPGNWCHPWPASANPGLSGMRSCATVEELRGAGVSPPRAQPAPARGCPKASQQTDRSTESEIRGTQHPDLSTVKHRNRCTAFHPYELAVGILIVARNASCSLD